MYHYVFKGLNKDVINIILKYLKNFDKFLVFVAISKTKIHINESIITHCIAYHYNKLFKLYYNSDILPYDKLIITSMQYNNSEIIEKYLPDITEKNANDELLLAAAKYNNTICYNHIVSKLTEDIIQYNSSAIANYAAKNNNLKILDSLNYAFCSRKELYIIAASNNNIELFNYVYNKLGLHTTYFKSMSFYSALNGNLEFLQYIVNMLDNYDYLDNQLYEIAELSKQQHIIDYLHTINITK